MRLAKDKIKGKRLRQSQMGQQIQQEVENQLEWDYRLHPQARIEVSVNNGSVILTGKVPTFFARKVAENDALLVGGVHNVDNQLTVDFPTKVKSTSDQLVKEKIERILETNEAVDFASLQIEVEGGEAYLRGRVSAYWIKDQIQDLVEQVEGVLKIDNAITVVPMEKVKDEIIAEQVRSAIKRNKNIPRELPVEVEIRNGVVIIKGEVPSINNKIAIYQIASRTKGVKEVRNNLVAEI